MRSTVKTRSPLSASNAKKLEELCAWISENSQQVLGWSQLIQQSGFTKEQLVELFQLYKQMTPLAFVRKVRQQHKKAIRCIHNPNFLTTLRIQSMTVIP